MQNRDQAEKLLRETARAMGIDIVGDGLVSILYPSQALDAWESRFTTHFRILPERNHGRPLARVLFDYSDIADAAPETLAALVKQRCGEAKAALISQLKETLARLEALP